MHDEIYGWKHDAAALPGAFEKARVTGGETSLSSGASYATITDNMAMAIDRYIKIELGQSEGAIGTLDGDGRVEYVVNSNDVIVILQISKNSKIKATRIDPNDYLLSPLKITGKPKDEGAIATLLMLFPKCFEYPEFKDNMALIKGQYTLGFDIEDTSKKTDVNIQIPFAKCCDILYRYSLNATAFDSIDVNTIPRTTQLDITSGKFNPDIVTCGTFIILANNTAKAAKKSTIVAYNKEDYVLNPTRDFTDEEIKRIPTIPDWYVMPEEVLSVCEHIVKTSKKASKMRNFMLRGPAGTGKTQGAKTIAALLGLPYVNYTCSADTEVFNFIGQMLPNTNQSKFDPLACFFDPETTYKKLTGNEDYKFDGDYGNLLQELGVALDGKTTGTSDFIYEETDFIRAIKYGWVCEIQEPTTITQPGVLTGLNSLLETEGTITLLTGEVIERHPDAVIIVTTNITYEGCRGLNQSVIDRMAMVEDIELPAQEDMVKRVAAKTGFTDMTTLKQMAEIISKIATKCHEEGIDDGVCGMRSLEAWAESVIITSNPYKSGLKTVINKVTSNADERQNLIDSCLTTVFSEGHRIKPQVA